MAPSALPIATRVSAPPAFAAALFAAVERLPTYEDAELRDTALQRRLLAELCSRAAELEALLEDIRQRLATWPNVAVVEGLRFDDGNRLLVALTGAFGDAVEPYGTASSRMVHRITANPQRTAGAADRLLNERPHTDSTDWPEPSDLTCLLCVRPDLAGGGTSRVIPSDWVAEQLIARCGAGAYDELVAAPVPWRIADELGGGILHARVFDGDRIRWLRYTIELAELDGVDPSTFPRSAVDALDRILQEPTRAFDHRLAAGELLLVNNRRTTHSRTAIPPESASERLLLRTKIQRRSLVDTARPRSWNY